MRFQTISEFSTPRNSRDADCSFPGFTPRTNYPKTLLNDAERRAMAYS